VFVVLVVLVRNNTMSAVKEKLISILTEKQKDGGLSDEVLEDIAKSLDMPLSEVYGVATFYSFLSVKPRGKYVIRVCKSLPCFYKNSAMILVAVEKELGIKPGEITTDGKFSLETTNCIGSCDNPPAMMINDEIHNGLTPEKVINIIRECK
jgi:NADH-quinone oxidoreductase subunit E